MLIVGVCREVWDTFQCECTTGWGGIDCSQGELIYLY